jgi:hypothetical protein
MGLPPLPRVPADTAGLTRDLPLIGNERLECRSDRGIALGSEEGHDEAPLRDIAPDTHQGFFRPVHDMK